MATDSGSEPDELIYTASVPPEHGHLHMVQTPGIPVLSFSQMDVAHATLMTTAVLLTMILSEILDKIPPSIINKEIPSTVENLLDGKQGIYITSKELKASDPDSPDYTLEFTITRPPHFGYLENALTGAYIKGRFTQKDLEQKAVHYGIPADMEVTADSFEFQVTDPAGNTMLPEVNNEILGFFDCQHRMEFRWSRVELSASCYHVCENAGTLAVQVVHSENSKDPAYIGIQVEEGTAKVNVFQMSLLLKKMRSNILFKATTHPCTTLT